MSAELGLAIASAIDIGLRYGNELRSICSALSDAENEISERTAILKQIQHILDDCHRELQERTLRVLIEKLTSAKSLLRNLVSAQLSSGTSGTEVTFVPKAVKYALWKGKLDEAIESLETWQRLSDPSWFLVFKIRDQRLDDVLRMRESISTLPIPSITSIRATLEKGDVISAPPSALSLPSEALSSMEISEIPFSGCKLAKGTNSGKATSYMIESIQLRHPDFYQQTKKDVRNLARRLQHDEPQTFGLLSCKGFIAKRADPINKSPAEFTIVSRTPLGCAEPRSLRDLLLNSEPKSLTEKFVAAQELAKAVSYVHVFGFVHKGIRPESIIRFDSREQEVSSVFLVGFEDFRKEDGRTQRLGASPSSDFIMQHDIYSLGVCLLELGLWQSFIEYNPLGENPTLSASLREASSVPSTEKSTQLILQPVKKKLMELTREQLPKYMGTQYSKIVETCLTCLDPENGDFSNQEEFEDEDGVVIGVRYIEKILHRLGRLYV
ncbi:hypothetical protein F4777DRAFT_599874 [Nemania sp. FL0916]|nr:hypothetical protein F4777DRAFT_599874 [Nemania sp. FL0916]